MLCVLSGTLIAQTSDAGEPTAVAKALAVAAEGAIEIDGRLDEPAWRNAPPITTFLQREPIEGAPPEERIEVRVLYDQGSIYIGAVLYERDPSRIRTQLVRRDQQSSYNRACGERSIRRST